MWGFRASTRHITIYKVTISGSFVPNREPKIHTSTVGIGSFSPPAPSTWTATRMQRILGVGEWGGDLLEVLFSGTSGILSQCTENTISD